MIPSALQRWRSARQLRRLPTTSIDRAPRHGAVKIVGVAVGTADLEAPLTGRRCLLYALDFREWENGVRYPLLRVRSDRPFSIDDDTGLGLIRVVDGAHTLLSRGSRVTGHSSDPGSPVRDILASLGISMRGRFGDPRSVEWAEWVLGPGEPLSVSGDVSWELSPDVDSYRDRAIRLAIRAGREPLVVLAGGSAAPS